MFDTSTVNAHAPINIATFSAFLCAWAKTIKNATCGRRFFKTGGNNQSPFKNKHGTFGRNPSCEEWKITKIINIKTKIKKTRGNH